MVFEKVLEMMAGGLLQEIQRALLVVFADFILNFSNCFVLPENRRINKNFFFPIDLKIRVRRSKFDQGESVVLTFASH